MTLCNVYNSYAQWHSARLDASCWWRASSVRHWQRSITRSSSPSARYSPLAARSSASTISIDIRNNINDNSCQLSSYLAIRLERSGSFVRTSIYDNFRNKNTPSERATKINKNQGRYFVVWAEEYSTLY